MLSTISLSLRLWATALFTLVVLYFLGMLAVGFTAGFGGLGIFMMAGVFTFFGSLVSLAAIMMLLPLLWGSLRGSRESTVFIALLLVTLVCGVPAAFVTEMWMHGPWLGPNAELLVFPGAAMVASWVAVFVQQESIVRYATPERTNITFLRQEEEEQEQALRDHEVADQEPQRTGNLLDAAQQHTN